MGCIYRAVNKINGKSYVGRTIHTMERRRSEHEYNALYGFSRSVFRNALRKYGVDGFEWIEEYSNVATKDLDRLEIETIAKYCSFEYGYNMTFGGDGGLGRRLSEMTKRRLSILKNGHEVSAKTRALISKARAGRPISEETKRKISKTLAGKTYEERFGIEKATQLREMRRKFRKENKLSKESIEKMRKSLTGKKRSKESVNKQKQTIKGRKLTEEHKRKIGIKSSQRMKGKTYEEIYGPEMAKQLKEKRRQQAIARNKKRATSLAI